MGVVSRSLVGGYMGVVSLSPQLATGTMDDGWGMWVWTSIYLILSLLNMSLDYCQNPLIIISNYNKIL